MKYKRETLTFEAPKRRDPIAKSLAEDCYRQRVERSDKQYRRLRNNDRSRLLAEVYDN
jgi:hypothetical protein